MTLSKYKAGCTAIGWGWLLDVALVVAEKREQVESVGTWKRVSEPRLGLLLGTHIDKNAEQQTGKEEV